MINSVSTLFPNNIEPTGPVIYGPGAKNIPPPYTLCSLSSSEKDAVARAKKYAMEQSIKSVLHKQNQNQQASALQNIKRQQTLALLNRIYVGSVGYDIGEEPVKEHFCPFGPIKSITMSWDGGALKHKGYAFIEYEYPESAVLSIEHLNNTHFNGRQMKVGRPSNLPNPDPLIKEMIETNQLYKRIFIAGVHEGLNNTDMADVFGAFGKITHCKLEVDVNEAKNHRGVGYIDYDSEQSANDAVASMNKFTLGGKILKVTKAICPTDCLRSYSADAPIAGVKTLPNAVALAVAAATAQALAKESEQLSSDERKFITAIPGQSGDGVSDDKIDTSEQLMEMESPPPPDEPPAHLPPECIGVLLLTNMVSPEEVDSELELEVRTECENFGIVRDVKMVSYPENEVRIFVQYTHPSAVSCAIQALDGRFFAGKQVSAISYDTEAFQSGDYTK